MNMLPDIVAALEPADGANQQSSSCAKIQRRLTLHKQGLALLAALLTLTPLTSHAGNLQLVNSPLFLTNQVKPNIILSIDDSGSMDSEVMMPTNDGALWWNTTDRSFTGRDDEDNSVPNVINFNKNGASNATWKKYVYLFPNGRSGSYDGRRLSADGTDSSYAIPPTNELAFTRSPDFNKGYYDPDVTYTPWTSFGGTTFGDVDPTNAPWDPVFSGPTPTIDLTVDIDNASSHWTFRFHAGMKDETGATVGSLTDKKVIYFAPTYYRIAGTADNTGYSASVSSSGQEPDGSTTMDKYEIKPGNYSTSSLYNTAIQNFANWISYYRRRHLAMRAGMGKSFEGLTALRAGLFTINNRVAVTMWDMATQSDTFYSNLYSSVGSGGTPNRQALDHAGQQYARTDAGAPITEACQQNYAIAFTDGFTTVNTSSGVGNADSGEGVPYEDGHSNTLADIAMHYYKTNPRTDLTPTGLVPTSALDKNADLHMVTYTVGLGVKGKIFGVTHNTVADAFAVPPTWQDPIITRNPIQVDDLYHAAINGRGQLLNATTPEKISEIMGGTLKNIIARTGTASSVAATSGVLTANSRVYQAKFTSGDWSGDLNSVQLDLANNQLGAVDWHAGEVLKTLDPLNPLNPTSRQIITWNGSQGIPFLWANLTATGPGNQQELLNTDPSTGLADTLGPDRLNFLRGDHSKEGDPFRARDDGIEDPLDLLTVDGNFVLGDIIDSGPVFVGVPPFLYPDDLEDSSAATKRYSDFRGTQASRIGMVYVGANDGMLHGFETVTGEERIAYVPSKVFANLNELTDPDYTHRNYVNGSPTYGDAFFGGSWRSVIVGTLAAGGQGVFALDVTTPASLAETNASQIALWEFTDADDPDLGFTYGQAVIVKTHALGGNNGKWAAIFGNGYNNTGSGHAVLYIVDIQTGALIHRIDTGAGSVGTPNGLATPAVIDADGDFIADFVFAGDLQGNMWKFDIRSSTPTNWKIPTAGTPLFTATDGGQPQPITVQPEVLSHPTGENGFMVYFGTGKYLEAGDNATTGAPTQTFYGIWDERGTDTSVAHATVAKNTLETQVIGSTTVGSQNVRTITNVLITAWGTDIAAGERMGWQVDLPDPGEKSVTNPIALGDRMLFTTLIPSVEPCDFGGTGFLMEINIVNGGTPTDPVFDLDGSGNFNVSGRTGTGQIIVGVDPNVGLLPQPAIFTDPASGIKLKVEAGTKDSDTGAIITNAPTGTPFANRRSWRQLQ